MSTRLSITRGPHGLRLFMPSGRHLDISADAAGARFIERLLADADSGTKHQPGSIGLFPTQAAADALLREERRRIEAQIPEVLAAKEEARKEEIRSNWSRKGVNIDAMSFKL